MDKYTRAVVVQTSLFNGIEAGELECALRELGAYTKTYEAGELLIRMGDCTRSFGIVIDGRVRIDFYDEAGNVSIVAAIGRGGSFAEAIACAGDPSIVQVEAASAARVIWIDISRAFVGPSSSGSVSARIVLANTTRMLARKNMLLNRKMQMIAQKRLRDRIKLFLLAQDDTRDVIRSTSEMTRSDLARYLSVDRSALSRELGRMRDEGLIALRGNTIEVLDGNFLEA
ncbi:Crp/Fnr family transcriptional regulator [Collinsella sp. AGMB00827]|uniref:Crp/Fnr family transcriptional regulator n=1 Tax=Collinsella ureilytica TaxID=2869515 RepID=A0ABS7MMG1_9ACTN|nr:Crp/Fnr family transcriptional regulator [Collinsella urealyticum]MBY4798261.1 Crp/Fnr family transcriptional regulator [Collinsella urealyticum]